MKYVKIRSWHIIATPTRVSGGYITLCNRSVVAGVTADDFGDDKTCETCFRKQAKLDASA